MWDESQRAALSKVGEADRLEAMAAARRYMDRRYRAMLEPEKPENEFQWSSAGLGVFLYRGRPVPAHVVRRQLDKVITGLEKETAALSENKDLAPSAWALGVARISKITALVGAAFATGGWLLIAPTLPAVEADIADELDYLDGFADEVAAGQTPRDGRFIRRAMLYAAAGFSFYLALRGDRARAQGYTEEMSNLDPAAEHCNSCVEEADRGWVPLGELVPVGDRDCRSNCRCWITYRDVTGGTSE